MTRLRRAATAWILVPVGVGLALALVLSACGSSGKSASTAGTATAPVIHNFQFSPNPVKVKAGTTVTWTNKDSTDHTVQADSGSFGSAHLGTAQTYSHTFSAAGTYTYHCAIHTYMKATVIVS